MTENEKLEQPKTIQQIQPDRDENIIWKKTVTKGTITKEIAVNNGKQMKTKDNYLENMIIVSFLTYITIDSVVLETLVRYFNKRTS